MAEATAAAMVTVVRENFMVARREQPGKELEMMAVE
jgi:hypothetical protein